MVLFFKSKLTYYFLYVDWGWCYSIL